MTRSGSSPPGPDWLAHRSRSTTGLCGTVAGWAAPTLGLQTGRGHLPGRKFKELIKVVRPANNDDYLGYYATRLEDMRGDREDDEGEFPYPIYPEDGRLLPWGYGPRGELFFWLTGGDVPDRWPVIWADTYFYDRFRYDTSMSEFLLSLVEDPPPEVNDIAQVDLAGSAPFRPFTATRPADTQYAAEPMVSGWTPRSAPETALAETLDAMHASAPKRQNEVAALLDTLPHRSTGRHFPDWPALQDRLAAPLPADYKAFYDTLGPGVFCDLNNPRARAVRPVQHDSGVERAPGADRQTSMSLIVTAHPQPKGVLPWGYAPDGRIYCWRVTGPDPADWCATLVTPTFTVVDHLDLSFSSFLLKYSGVRDRARLSEQDGPPWIGDPAFIGTGAH